MAIFRGIGGAGDSNTDATLTAVTEKATAAAASASAAAGSASDASTYAANSSTYASNSYTYSVNAQNSYGLANTAKIAAEAAKTAAQTSETNASASETAAAASETAAAASATSAATSLADIGNAETNAANSASSASTSATAAAASATAAASSASAASTSATNAATSETNAGTSETNAASSETAAAASATSAASSASSASTSASNASTSATNAATSETNAATSETNAASSATSAASSSTSASTSASNASTSETNAASSASAASTSASNAATSATAAGNAQTAAETAQAAAEAAQEAIDGLYLGAQASDPTLDNNGDAVTAGDWYYNTTTSVTRIYDGSVWQNGAVSTAGFLLSGNNLSDLGSATTARTNLGVAIGSDVQAYSSVLAATTASFTTAKDSKLSGIETGADVTDATNVAAAGAAMDSDFASQGLMKRGATSGSYSIVTDNSTNWNTAYGWGDHSSAGYLTDITGENLGDLSNVTLTSPSNGQILKYNGTAWVNGTDAGGIALTDLSVGTEGTASGDGAIAYNNTTGVFTYTPPTPAGIGAATSAQGITADSAVQPGDNISTLTNDSGFITASDNITGNASTATTATNVAVTSTVTGGQYLYVPFITGTSDGNYGLQISSDIRVYPSLNIVYLDANTTVNGALYPVAIDFSDGTSSTEHLRFGSSDDVKFFYRGNANTMEMELEAAPTSFIITDNGTTRFTFAKSTGDFTATGDVNAVDGTFSGNVTGANLNVSNWDTAYGWGDHSTQNYLNTSSTVDGGTY